LGSNLIVKIPHRLILYLYQLMIDVFPDLEDLVILDINLEHYQLQ
jgi:hypothetical protein